MENYLYAELDHSERIQLLIKQALSRESMTFRRSLTEQDISEKKDFFTREAMRLATTKEEFKNWKARKAQDIKTIEKNQEDLLEVISTESIEVFDEVFLIPDHAKGLVLFVDKLGEIVNRREMKPEERQGRLLLDEPGETAFEEAHVVEENEPETKQPANEPPVESSEKKKRGRKPKAPPVEAEQSNGIPEADPEAMGRVKEM